MSPLPMIVAPVAFLVDSESTPGKRYLVTLPVCGHDECATCQCPDFIYNHRAAGTHCKHIAQVHATHALLGALLTTLFAMTDDTDDESGSPGSFPWTTDHPQAV